MGERSITKKLFIITLLLFFIALLYSKFLLSISMFMWIGLGIYGMILNRSNLKMDLSRFSYDWAWSLLTIPFFIIFLSGIYSDDTIYWLERCRIKLPFLTLPFFFFWLPRLTTKDRVLIFSAFVTIMLVSSGIVIANLLIDFDLHITNLKQGIPIPTPIHHIRYSLLVGLASFLSFVIYVRREATIVNRKWYLFASIFLFVILHLLAVRNGLICFYGVSLIFWTYAVIVKKRQEYRHWGLVFVVPLFAYFSLPSLRSRIDFMFQDLQQIGGGNIVDYSDAERWNSIVIGWRIFKENPWLGTGGGDLRREVARVNSELYDRSTFLMPHNQWISTLAATGMVGGILFILAFVGIYVHQHGYRDVYYSAVYWMIMPSFLFENTIETSIGVAIVLFFFLINLRVRTTLYSGLSP